MDYGAGAQDKTGKYRNESGNTQTVKLGRSWSQNVFCQTLVTTGEHP
jgi:hypothetical protein